MPADAVVRARVESEVKEEARAVLDKMGLSLSDAVRLLLVRVAREHALPFDVYVPNDETAKAIEELERGEGEKFDNVDDFLRDLRS